MTRNIVDTGPLVAYFNRRDRWHRWVVDQMDLVHDASAIESLVQRYADTTMSLADACLVGLTERLPDCRLFTLDADFENYRRNGRHMIPLLHPA